MKKIRTGLALLIALGFISTLVGGVGYVYGNPGEFVTDNFDNESYIASKTNLVVSGGQVKLDQVTCDGVEWGGYCWHESASSQSCTSVCATHGGNVGTCQENDNTTCSLCRTFHPGAACTAQYDSTSPEYWPDGPQCFYRASGTSGSCSATYSWGPRFCACNN